MFNLKSKIEEATSKYAKGDDAYELQLKNQIRDSLGYANYVDRKNKLSGKPLDMDFSGKLKPEAVSNVVAGETGRRADEQAHLTNLANRTDTAAGSLAAMASKGRGSSADKINQMFTFESEDWLDEQMKDYSNDPYKGESEDKIVDYYDFDSFKTDLKENIKNRINSDVKFRDNQKPDLYGNYTPENVEGYEDARAGGMFDNKSPEEVDAIVDARIEQRFPEEARGDFLNTYLQASGYTPAQAEKVSGLTRYAKGQMTEAQKTVYELLNQPLIDSYVGSVQNDRIFDALAPRGTGEGPVTNGMFQKAVEEGKTVADVAKEQFPDISSEELQRVVVENSGPVIKDMISTYLDRPENEGTYKDLKKTIREGKAIGFYKLMGETDSDISNEIGSLSNMIVQTYGSELIKAEDVNRMLLREMQDRIKLSDEKAREDAQHNPTHIPHQANEQLWGRQGSINTGASDWI